MTNAPILDTAVQSAHEWLHEIGYGLGFDNERAAHAALRATLHAVRDRMPVEHAAHFAAGLPTLIRGIYYDGWHPSAARLKASHSEDFALSVRRELHGHDELQNTERVTKTVMRVIDHRMETQQINHMLESQPKSVRDLWQAARQQDLVQG